MIRTSLWAHGPLRHNPRMNAWLESQKVRVLIPLVGAAFFTFVSLTSLVAMMTGTLHHYYWRPLVFGTCLVTLGSVTGIKTRRK